MLPNLVDLCLHSVADNLSKYNLLFTTSDDFHTKQKLKFLQKTYSQNLISRLCTEDGLPEEFIDIVVNKYTKFLDTSWFKKCPLEKLSSKLAEIGSNLEKILCNSALLMDDFPEAVKDAICHLTNLKSFTFHFKCDDWILRNVAKFCRNIEEIDVECSPITSDGVRSLCRDRKGKLLCTTLKKLYFGEGGYISDNDVKYLLKNLPSLEVIGYPDLPWVLYSLHKENLPSLDKVAPYNITTLDLTKCSNSSFFFFANIVKICASVCPRLKNFSCALSDEEQLSCLCNLPDMEQVHFESDSNSKINIDSYLTSKGSRLTSLSIDLCTVSVSVLAENCPCLEELLLYEANVLCDEDSKPVFNSLSSLAFFGERMHEEGIKSVLSSSLIQLESLSFRGVQLESPELKRAILKCCELCPIKHFTINKSDVEKKFIEDLLCTCRTLDYLTADGESYDRKDLLDFTLTFT